MKTTAFLLTLLAASTQAFVPLNPATPTVALRAASPDDIDFDGKLNVVFLTRSLPVQHLKIAQIIQKTNDLPFLPLTSPCGSRCCRW